MRIVTKVLLTALTLLVVANYLPGIQVTGLKSAIIAACVLGVLNALVKPVVVLLTLPVTVVTLGLFLLVVNASFFALAAVLVHGFTVEGPVPALIGSLVVSFAGVLSDRLLTRK